MSPAPGKGMPDEQQPEQRVDSASVNQPRAATSETPGGTTHGAPKSHTIHKAEAGVHAASKSPLAADQEWTRKEQTSEPAIVAPELATGSAGLADYARETAKARREEGQTTSPPIQESPAGGAQSPSHPQPAAGGPPTPAAGIDPRTGDTGGRTASGAAAARQSPEASESGQLASGGTPAESGTSSGGKATSKEELAKHLGFVSFLELFEGSQPVEQAQGNVLYLTAVAQQHWVVWNSHTLEYSRPFPTQEQAKQARIFTG